ncbi:MAG TPA: hypothetical protein VF594_02935 [Rubricoccaceae bacterium]|jgi:hypothetical protein
MRLLLALSLVAALPAAAQPAFSVRAGVNAATLTPQLYRDGTGRAGAAVSVYATLPLRGGLSLRPEALFSSEGVGVRPSTTTYTLEDGTENVVESDGGALQAEYLGLGAFVAFEAPAAGLSLGAYAGPTVTLKVRERSVDRSDGQTFENSSNVLDLSAIAAAGGVTARRGRTGLDLRYALSAHDIISRDLIAGGGAVRSSVATAALVYQFGR